MYVTLKILSKKLTSSLNKDLLISIDQYIIKISYNTETFTDKKWAYYVEFYQKIIFTRHACRTLKSSPGNKKSY